MTMPPTGFDEFATKRDLSELEKRIDLRFDAIDERFKGLDERFKGLDERFKGLDERFDYRLETLEHKLSAQFSEGLREQTRTFIVWMFTAFFALGALLGMFEAIAG